MQIVHTGRVAGNVLQRRFDIEIAGETVPCVLWEPVSVDLTNTLIALGHGGAQHKMSPDIRARAIRYARERGWASLAIDAPGQGERVSPEEAELSRLQTLARISGAPDAPSMPAREKIELLDALAAKAVPEWRGALHVVLEHLLPTVTSLAYWGISQGTWIGVPLLAVETRFRCAVLGLSQLHPDHLAFRKAAEQIETPLRFVLQWDDHIRTREYGIALFDAFGSRDKSMHVNPGGHTAVPRSEMESWDAFLGRYLD